MVDDNSAKRRALEPAVDERLVIDMEQLKSFILDQNRELQDTINKKLQETIENNNKDNIQSLQNVLDQKLDSFAGYVDSKIESVRVHCVDKIDDLSTEVTKKIRLLNEDVDDRIDFLERQTKLCDLVIKNIPYRQDENMENIVYDICYAIDFKNTKAIKSAFRLSRNQNRSNPIILKFFEVADKREFMYLYFKHQQLNLSDVGFRTKLRIVICEALTRKNNEIFKKAMEFKFKKIFWSVSTKNGLVYYRLDQKSRMSRISSLSSLNAFSSTGTSEIDKQNPILHEQEKKTVDSPQQATENNPNATSTNANSVTANLQQMVTATSASDISTGGQ